MAVARLARRPPGARARRCLLRAALLDRARGRLGCRDRHRGPARIRYVLRRGALPGRVAVAGLRRLARLLPRHRRALDRLSQSACRGGGRRPSASPRSRRGARDPGGRGALRRRPVRLATGGRRQRPPTGYARFSPGRPAQHELDRELEPCARQRPRPRARRSGSGRRRDPSRTQASARSSAAGSTNSAKSKLLKPVTATSAGTRSLRRRSSCRTPRARRSFPHMIAVGGRVEPQQLVDERRAELRAPGALEALESRGRPRRPPPPGRRSSRVGAARSWATGRVRRRTRCGDAPRESRCSVSRRCPLAVGRRQRGDGGSPGRRARRRPRAHPARPRAPTYQRRNSGSPERNRNAPSARCSSSGVSSASEASSGRPAWISTP